MMTKISVKDWRKLPTTDWTVTTFRQFLADQHEAKYAIKYTTRSFAVEGRWLKSMISEHGPEVVRSFIEVCFAEYRPTRDYPGLNFAFMFSYQRARVLPRVLADVKRRAAVVRAEVENEQIDDWL